MAQVDYFPINFAMPAEASAPLDESAISATHGAPIVQNKKSVSDRHFPPAGF